LLTGLSALDKDLAMGHSMPFVLNQANIPPVARLVRRE